MMMPNSKHHHRFSCSYVRIRAYAFLRSFSFFISFSIDRGYGGKENFFFLYFFFVFELILCSKVLSDHACIMLTIKHFCVQFCVKHPSKIRIYQVFWRPLFACSCRAPLHTSAWWKAHDVRAASRPYRCPSPNQASSLQTCAGSSGK